jgi:WD40 repeat protein
VTEKLFSVCQIRSKKFDIFSLAGGTIDGYLHLYPYPIYENYEGHSWEGVKSHRNSITNVLYSRDTNLIFSSGEDGNIFIYCIYELPDGENIAFDDNKALNLNQLSSILDEGLGDNVLYPLHEIFNYEDQALSLSNLLVEEKKQKAFLISNHQ